MQQLGRPKVTDDYSHLQWLHLAHDFFGIFLLHLLFLLIELLLYHIVQFSALRGQALISTLLDVVVELALGY